jgi:hypothetical protein
MTEKKPALLHGSMMGRIANDFCLEPGSYLTINVFFSIPTPEIVSDFQDLGNVVFS